MAMPGRNTVGAKAVVRLPFARFATVAALCALALAPVACSSSKSNTSSGTSASTKTPAVSNDWALAYTGGKAGKANPSLSPVVIGYVNQEGGVPAFPEATEGFDAAVQYVNDELGGIQGHPIKIEKCLVVANEDGQKCGTQLANDNKVKLVITGTMTVGNQALYNTIAATKPVLVSNPVVTSDFLTRGTYAYTPGGPGVVQGMGVFVAKNLHNVRKVSIIYGDSEAEVFGAEGLLVPKLKSYGIKDVTLQKISDAPTAPDVQNALTAAGADKADVVMPIVTVQGCIATYDALKSLGIKTPVVTTGLCFGTPMTKHLADLGSTDTVPDGWYFGDYGYSYFVPEAASGMSTYLAKVQQFGPKNVEYTGFAGPTFANLMTATKFYNQLGPDASTTALLSSIKSFTGPMMIVAGPMKCGFSSLFQSLCGTHMGIMLYKNHKWTAIASGINNKAIDPYTG
jgi:branched-chain amino acid transport system substrate-binding protein